MTQFNEFNLAKPIQRAIQGLGYETPSPIQKEMIPVLLEGNDAIGIAQTGTGKTAAFLLPLLTILSQIKGKPQKGKCDVLILTPTRELASQILDNARTYGQHMKFASALIVGGARYEGQLRALAKGVNLIVATPGRLIDHIESGAADLSHVSYVVLDEADQMLDMGFVPAIRQIMATVPDERQTILTSATMPKPIEKLAGELLKSPKRIAVSRESEPAKNVRQDIIFVDKPQKPTQLRQILDEQEWSKVIIFTRTKRGADKVQVQLIKAGVLAQSLHGDKSFGQRRYIMEEFKSGEVPVLVATDLAGRGLDIDDVSLVINYDMPNIAESYVHRIGRTGRAGRKGVAISLVDRSEKAYLRDIEALMGVKLGGTQGVAKPDGAAPNKAKGDRPKGDRPKGDKARGDKSKREAFKKDKPKSESSFKDSKSRRKDGKPSFDKKFDKNADRQAKPRNKTGSFEEELRRFEANGFDVDKKPNRKGGSDKAADNAKGANRKSEARKSDTRKSEGRKSEGRKSDTRKSSSGRTERAKSAAPRRQDGKKAGTGRMKRSVNFKKGSSQRREKAR